MLLRGQRGVEISVPPAVRGRTSIGQTQILAGRAWRRGRRSLPRTTLDQSTGLRCQGVGWQMPIAPISAAEPALATVRIWAGNTNLANRPDLGNRPNLGGDRPSLGNVNRPTTLPASINRPGTGGDGPSLGGNRPGVGGNGPSLGGNRPGSAAMVQALAVIDLELEATGQESVVIDQISAAIDRAIGGNRPGPGGDRPGIGGDRPGIRADRPGIGGDRPGVGGDRPGHWW